MQRRKNLDHSPEYKKAALRLYEKTDRSLHQVAIDLHVEPTLLQKWHREAEAKKSGLSPQLRLVASPSSESQAEKLLRLERDKRILLNRIARLKQEHQVLKNAMALLAQEKY